MFYLKMWKAFNSIVSHRNLDTCTGTCPVSYHRHLVTSGKYKCTFAFYANDFNGLQRMDSIYF